MNSMFIAIAMSLATFDILPAHDGDGKPIIPDTGTLTGIVRYEPSFPSCCAQYDKLMSDCSYPTSFDYEIKLRSKECAELIANQDQ